MYAEQIFDQSFGGARNPDGWVIQGEQNAPDRFTPGTPKTIWDFFQGGQGFMRLTTSGPYERASAFYTNEMVWSTDWKIEAEIHMDRGADGMAFSWVGVTGELPIDDGIIQVGELLGGFGNWLGAPRGPGLSNPQEDGLGWYNDVGGYSLQFLTYSNRWITGKKFDTPPWATNYESTLCRNLRSWKPPYWNSIFSYLDDPTFFVAPGFVRFVLMQSTIGSTGHFALTWGPTYATTNTWIITDYMDYPAYFGVSAGTGGVWANHDVKNFTLYGEPVPEPTAWMGMALATLCFARRRCAHVRL